MLQGKFTAAEYDCNIALRIDSSCAKALLRRALAREKLDRIEEAMEDYNQVCQPRILFHPKTLALD